jgi:acetyl coenzyme A synthetase (ADP forming)-like protein
VNQDVLNGLIRPQNVAIIGASATPGKIGHTVVKNLIEGGYKGGIYPVNPDSEEILGKKVYKSVKDIPGPVDAAIITIPAKYVSPVIDECGVKGVKGLIVITSGFSEVGRKDLEEEMVQKAHQYGMCVLGPNIVGTLSNADKFNGSFAPFLPLPGKSSLVTQSGALLIAIDAASFTRRVGFEKLISIGNVSDVGFADLVTWLNDDPATFCISLYIEGLKDGRDFIEAGKKAKKPIIALKSGVSSHGAAAAASHTGSLAGAAKIYSAAFQQAGVIQAQDLNDLFNRTQVLSLQPPMKGEKLLVLTNGGGVGVLATDAAEKYGLPLMFAPDDVQEELRKHMPDFGSAKNPVDMTGMAGNEWYRETTQYSFAHPWVDGLCVLYCETAMTDPQGIAESIKAGIDATGIKDKPVTVSFVGGERSDNAMRWLVENGIPAYGAPDLAVNAMACLREYARFKEIAAEPDNRCDNQDKTKALAVIEAARKDGRDSLTEIEAKQVFAAYDLPVTKIALAKTEDEAVELASKTGFPVVMKIVSPDILHKSDAGGVKVNVKDEAGVRDTWKTIMANVRAYKPEADIHGIAIQEMAPWGTEVILGSINDASFGPTIMFGLGGIFVEVLKDVTFRVTPVTQGQARRMLSEIRGAPILKGARGEPPRDQVALVETICKFSNMILDLKDEISETDANPLLVYEEGKGLKVADARVILKPKE